MVGHNEAYGVLLRLAIWAPPAFLRLTVDRGQGYLLQDRPDLTPELADLMFERLPGRLKGSYGTEPHMSLPAFRHQVDLPTETRSRIVAERLVGAQTDAVVFRRALELIDQNPTLHFLAKLAQCPRQWFTPSEAFALVAAIYTDVPEFLHPVARFSVWSHLRKLADDGDATAVDADDPDSIWLPV